jgi:RNA polymerase sigma factor (sigma-70 family)
METSAPTGREMNDLLKANTGLAEKAARKVQQKFRRVPYTDLFSYAMEGLWSGLRSLPDNPVGDLGGWLYTAAYRRALSEAIRQRITFKGRDRLVQFREYGGDGSGGTYTMLDKLEAPELDAQTAERQRLGRLALAAGLNGLSDKDKKLLHMIYVQDMSSRQVAEVFGHNYQAVYSRLSYIYGRLSRLLARDPEFKGEGWVDVDGSTPVIDSVTASAGPKYRRVKDPSSVYGFTWREVV